MLHTQYDLNKQARIDVKPVVPIFTHNQVAKFEAPFTLANVDVESSVALPAVVADDVCLIFFKLCRPAAAIKKKQEKMPAAVAN